MDCCLNPFDFNPYLADAAVRTVTETAELARLCSVLVMNMHLSRVAGETDKHGILTLAERLGCTLLLETKTLAGLKQPVDWMKTNKYLQKKNPTEPG